MDDNMESHGMFGKQRSYGNRGGRKVNFKNEHDDRCGDGDEGGSRGYENNRGGYSRGRGDTGGRWTRGRGRDRRGGNRQNFRHGDNYDSYGGKKRYTPYTTKSPPGAQRGRGDSRGGRRGSVFSRLGGQDGNRRGGGGGKGNVFGRLSRLDTDIGSRGQSWHKIMVVGVNEGNEDQVLSDLQAQCQEPFQPKQIHMKGDKLMFFIEEHRAAIELKQLKDSSIVVKPSPPPRGIGGEGAGRSWNSGGGGGNWDRSGWKNPAGVSDRRTSLQRFDSEMEEDCTAVLLQVLGDRFDTRNLSLDLSDMFHDRTLQQHSIRGSMFDGNFVSSILELISTHCPTLNALDLSKNRLQRLDMYSSLKEKCPNLQILDLSDNELSHIQGLEALGQMATVTTLVLENNPLMQYQQDFASYAGNVRKYFPNLHVLDGQQLPSPVKFDLPSSSGSLPTSQKGYLVNEEVRSLVVSFLEQYYTIYDGETRDKLLEAYSDNAVFSMCVNVPQHHQRGNPYPYSRNLARVKETGKRSSMIKRGRIDIVQLLRNLPRSYHLASTFSVDVMKASPVSTAFTVHGVFSEAASGPKSDFFPIRSFTRTFVIVPAGNGVAIVNDQLSIRTANSQIIKQHQDDVHQHFAPNQPSGFSAVAGLSPTSAGPSFGSAQQQSLVHQSTTVTNVQDAIMKLSAATQMNVEWSRKCLEENNWDLEKALTAFSFINNQGKIPPEAFTQTM